MDGLFQIICRTGIFMICAQAIIHFRPQEGYEKYLKLLASAMVLVQIFLPVGSFLSHGDSEGLAEKQEAFLKGLEEEMSAAESRAFQADSLLEQMTLEEVRRRVEEARAQAAAKGVEPSGNENQSIEPEPADGAADNTADGTVNIERIETEEIRVRLGTE